MRTEYKEGEELTANDVGLVFRSRDGKQWKIVCVSTEGHILTLNKCNDDYNRLYLDGKLSANNKTEFDEDLVSFVGPDFTEEKKLRRFEFDSFILEFPESPPNRDDSIDLAIGMSCSVPSPHKIWFSEEEMKNVKKFKITMEELPND